MGVLRVKGTLALSQFWPDGLSDADTAHIQLADTEDAITFQAHPELPAKPTSVFTDAVVVGKSGRKAPIHKQSLTLRFQGIDAPELHYRPAPLGKLGTPAQQAKYKARTKEYRQALAETATVALADYLRSQAQGADSLEVVVETNVGKPNDVFDTYGRFVGDLLLTEAGQTVNVNTWLLEQGWAFPTFYVSQTPEEIKVLLDAWKNGKKLAKRLGKRYLAELVPFAEEQQFRRGGPVAPAADVGRLNMPKFYRRQTTWWAQRQAGIFKKSYAEFLAAGTDQFVTTADYLQQGGTVAYHYPLAAAVKGTAFLYAPADFVFTEAASRLLDSSGKPIVAW